MKILRIDLQTDDVSVYDSKEQLRRCLIDLHMDDILSDEETDETYETIIKAKNKEDAEKKALLLDLSKWDDCKSENMDSMSIDSVEELEDER